MKHLKIRQSILAGAALALVSTLAACGPKAPPVIAPPPPKMVVIPPQPMPPRGASPNLVTPPINTYGVRQTINTGISPAQTTWNLRSAYNVAALNCMDPKHAQILVNYREFLKTHAKKLTQVNKTVDNEFKAKFGPRFIAPRELYMTQVYNYFALPPTQSSFCDAALAMSNEAATLKSADIDSFAARNLPSIEQVFLRFYTSFDQYRVDLAAWQAKYMMTGTAPVPAPQPLSYQLSPTPAQAPAQ
ncbi:hypothetical protein KRR38_15900 [Novosphingobium sp. G106]|uniref:hypothetical protein n=1 Tax=Novosphingobium sp. G106 TaxID=2849500 RepID=UPI001C2CE892|nr:hypothetical protein [Novosphingobium sp. G106]MBV1689115.1 hypothetical protein [Novosphingobium sp. G106]